MQMSTRCGGDFTTNSSVVDQISKRQDVCLVSFKNPTTHFSFRLRKLYRDSKLTIKLFLHHDCLLLRQKLLPKEKGVSPVQIEQKYIAESEFALLGILSKTMSNYIFLFRFQWTTRMQAEIINVHDFFRCESHCANVGRLANTTLRHHSESSEHSRNSLGRRSTCFLHRLKALINVFDIFSLGVPTELRE